MQGGGEVVALNVVLELLATCQDLAVLKSKKRTLPTEAKRVRALAACAGLRACLLCCAHDCVCVRLRLCVGLHARLPCVLLA